MKSLNPIFLETDYERRLYDAAMYNLWDEHNSLRFNNFAYAMRELFRHILYRKSPDALVRRCPWYKVIHPKDTEIYRADRLRYLISGGMSNSLMNQWGIKEELDVLQKEYNDMIDGLNEFTHIEPHSFGMSAKDVEKRADEVFDLFDSIADLIKKCQDLIREALDEQLHELINDKFEFEVDDNIDILSTHHRITHYNVVSYEVERIDDDTIGLILHGEVGVEHQYGSDSDVRKGDGWEVEMTYPFEVKAEAPLVFKPQYLKVDRNTFVCEVNTDEFYE